MRRDADKEYLWGGTGLPLSGQQWRTRTGEEGARGKPLRTRSARPPSSLPRLASPEEEVHSPGRTRAEGDGAGPQPRPLSEAAGGQEDAAGIHPFFPKRKLQTEQPIPGAVAVVNGIHEKPTSGGRCCSLRPCWELRQSQHGRRPARRMRRVSFLGRDQPFSAVPGDRARSNGQKSQVGGFRLNVRQNRFTGFTEQVKEVEAPQRGTDRVQRKPGADEHNRHIAAHAPSVPFPVCP